MWFRSPLFIIILRTISRSWTLILVIGMFVTRTFAENNINQTEKIHSIMQNSSNNETIENESRLTAPVTEKQSRMLHKLEHHSIKGEKPHRILNKSNSQNHSFESEVSALRSSEKNNISIKPTLKNSRWLYNNKSPAHGKREAYEGMRKSATSEIQQYDAQAYKDYYQQQQHQQEQSKSEYTDSYNTIPSNAYINEIRDYGNIAEEQDIPKWQNSYLEGGGSSSYGCPCYHQTSTRYNNDNCDSPGSSFLSTAGMLGANLWQLIQIMATSAVPFVIPILALKLILVPLKILKFLHLIKFFFKLFIVLPFIIRVFYPAISNGLGLQNFFYSKLSNSHPDHHYDHLGSREESNATGNWHSDLEEYIPYYSNISGGTLLRACPSKAACELGSFLSTTNTKFPEKLSKYLMKKTEGAEEAEKTSEKDDSLESEKESAIRAFIIALGRKWSIEQCVVYTCSLSL